MLNTAKNFMSQTPWTAIWRRHGGSADAGQFREGRLWGIFAHTLRRRPPAAERRFQPFAERNLVGSGRPSTVIQTPKVAATMCCVGGAQASTQNSPPASAGEDRGEPATPVHVASPAARRRPDSNSSRCSAFRKKLRSGITTGLMARSRPTISRASSSRPI